MRHVTYFAVLVGCLAAAIWLEPVLRLGVLRQWRRLAAAVLPVAFAFVLWDIAALRAGHWRLDPEQTTGVVLPAGLPLEELLFFLVIPVCAVLGYEAVRAMRPRP